MTPSRAGSARQTAYSAQPVVSLGTLDNGKHTWPGSAHGTTDIHATPQILDFFAQHGCSRRSPF